MVDADDDDDSGPYCTKILPHLLESYRILYYLSAIL